MILAISGSLRSESSSTAVLRAAVLLAPPGVEVALYDGLAGLPAFDSDVDQPGAELPAAASELRARVSAADALLICSPEYAHGIPGSLKNLLDWLVGCADFSGKPVTLLTASARSVFAQTQLAEVLRTMSAHLVPDGVVVVPVAGRAADAAAVAADPLLAAVLRGALAALLQHAPAAVGATATRRSGGRSDSHPGPRT